MLLIGRGIVALIPILVPESESDAGSDVKEGKDEDVKLDDEDGNEHEEQHTAGSSRSSDNNPRRQQGQYTKQKSRLPRYF